jgi:3-hydroxymyristoyl/3-hydroxydecanoyl-(acyl carrier protein) dehydratase
MTASQTEIRPTSSENRRLRLGPSTVQRLLPHRAPMLFVDFVAGYERTPRPSLRAGRYISANDPTFAGHFPELGIWPGVYTVEGLNQACNLLATISALQKEWEGKGRDPAEVLEGLRQIDQLYELKPSLRSDSAKNILETLQGSGRTMGLSVGIDIRFTSPVFPGSRLEYVVFETHASEGVMIYEAEALVEGSTVAKGKLTLARGRTIPSF